MLPTTHNHNTLHNFQKTPTPWSPPPTGFQRIQFYRWVQSPCVARSISITATRRCDLHLHETNCFFILLTIILYPADRRTLGQKVCFFSEYLCFFPAVASNQCALTPAIRQYIFHRCRPSPHHVLAWFWTRGVGAPLSWLSLVARRACRYVNRYRSYVGVHHRVCTR